MQASCRLHVTVKRLQQFFFGLAVLIGETSFRLRFHTSGTVLTALKYYNVFLGENMFNVVLVFGWSFHVDDDTTLPETITIIRVFL